MSHVEVVRRGRILEVTLSKPKVNAIDRAMSQEMGAAFALLRDDPDLWCAILTGSGEKIFSAGCGEKEKLFFSLPAVAVARRAQVADWPAVRQRGDATRRGR